MMRRKVNSKAAFAAIALLGTSSTSAMAVEIIKPHSDRTNLYVVQPMSTTIGTTSVIESPVVITDNDTTVFRQLNSPAVIRRSTATNVVIEDQLVKEKHLFKIGLGPLFQFHIK